MRALASSGRPTGPLPTCSRRVAALVLTSALLAACSESPIAPAADIPGAISKNLTATTNVGPYSFTGTSSYANEAGPNGTSLYYIGFANTLKATWDDITITQGATVISENFNNGNWNTTNFEVADPANNPGSAVGGAYFSSGCECNTPNNSRGLLRTKAQFMPTATAPLTIEGTLASDVAYTYAEDMSFIVWRGSGSLDGANLAMRMHNWDGWTPIDNGPADEATQKFGPGFYDGRVRIKIIDDGTNITVTFTKLPPMPATIQITNMPSAPSIDGSFTPQFAYTGDRIPSVASSTEAVCSVAGDVVNFIGAGTCTLTASAPGSPTYEAATGTAQNVTVGKRAATISMSDVPASAVVGDAFIPTVSYEGDGVTSVASSTTGVCTVTDGVVNTVGAGTCTLTASATAGDNYLAVTGEAQNVTVGKAAASISISNIPASDVFVGGSFTPTYEYVGDGTRSVASSTTGVCTVTGGVVRYVGSGTCTLTASLAEGANYLAANGSDQSFTVLPAPSTAAFTVNGGNPVQVNTPVAINGAVPSGYSMQYKIGSGAYVTGSTVTFTTTGVFQVCLRPTDGSTNGTESCLQVPVYDPTAGFVTGGGWFTSPAAAYKLGPTLTGKAHFAFVAKYQKGANVPTGNTSFQFEVAGLSFASTSIEWLVVQGSSTSTNNTAQYKGVGKLTIGGVVQTGNYGFMLWAQDGMPDQFRIAITNPSGTMVYDNKIGSEFGTAISGGSIIVHIPKK